MDPKVLREQINKLGTDMKALTDKAKGENRNLTAEEAISFDKMDTDREAALKEEQRWLKIENLDAGTGRRTEPDRPNIENRATKPSITAAERFEAMRAWLLTGSDEGVTAEQRQVADKCGINIESKRMNLRLADSALRSLKHEDVKAWTEAREQRALSSLTTVSPDAGSYLIPDELMAPLERALLAFGAVRPVADVRRTSGGNPYPIPTNDDTSNKGVLLSESGLVTEQDTTFNQLVLGAYKFSSKMVLVPIELLQDSATDLASFLGAALGERIGRITNDYFTTGTGSSEPSGIVTGSVASGTQLAAQTPTNAELVAIEHSVDPAYRIGARWMFADSMLAEMKKITDASTGRPIWLPNMIGGQPDSILGYPYQINQSMAAAAGSGAGKSILFGQLSKYIIRDVRDVTLLRLDERYAEYHQVAFLAFSRHDGALLDAGTHPVKHALNKT